MSANRLWRHPRGLPRAAHRLPVMFLLPWAVNQLRLVGVNGPYSVSLSPANEPEPPLICAARNLILTTDNPHFETTSFLMPRTEL
jgi:hypothetical protein